jgi:mannose-6-phosphate isomerase-like protein (cupin superfamily)
MLVKDIKKSSYFKALDETILCELLHPEKEGFDMGCSIAHAVLGPGQSSLPHKLSNSIEVYYILEGDGIMHIEGEKEIVCTGQAVYIPSNSEQWIKNIGENDLKFLCIVSPPWKGKEEKLCQ